MYKLYIGNKNYSSWSLRPWILLKTLDIPFAEVLVPFDDGNSWAKFRQFSPTGLVPCLQDGEVTVWESLAIVEYIAEAHAEVWPEQHQARAWARAATAEMHAGFQALRNDCPMSVGLRIQLHQESAALGQNIERLSELWQQGLSLYGGPFLAGAQFTAVDAFFAPVAFRVQTYSLTLPEACQRYVNHLLALPQMQSWRSAALQETFREPSHEIEMQAIGTWLEDLRA